MQKTFEQWKTDKIVLNVARVAHAANREWCRIHGDFSILEWDKAPIWQTSSIIDAVARCFFNMEVPTPKESHQLWVERRRVDGWGYGPVKDGKHKLHPNMIPWEELPSEQRQKDYVFCALIKSFLEG